MGGGTGLEAIVDSSQEGLSPRGRGNLSRRNRQYIALGSIPAWAGEPEVVNSEDRKVTVYPRVGGGNPAEDIAGGVQRRSIPAWAGEP